MAGRISRRRAVSRWLTLAAGATIGVGWTSRPTAAQTLEPPTDVPWTEPVPPVEPPFLPRPGEDDILPAPVSQANDDAERGGEPPPEIAPAGPWGVPPIKLMIPVLGVEAAVEAVGQDPDGAMSVPTFPDDVAWYKLGPGMGVPGNVVFAGHINWDGRVRAFGFLERLDEGDVIQVVDEKQRGYEYVVESKHWVRAEGAPLEEIFAQPDHPLLTLITCGGEYVPSRREYLDRLIVKARGA
jgi:hypothetical protein